MVSSSWSVGRLSALRRLASTAGRVADNLRSLAAEPAPPVVGLVLSGGGATAGFQVGAMRYLYDHVGITPSVITGTSAGSMMAVLLAQADDHDGQRRRLADIERIYADLSTPADMMVERGWFGELQKLTPALQRAREPRPPRLEARTITLPALGLKRPRRRSDDDGLPGGPVIRLPRWDVSPMWDTLSVLWTVSRSHPDFEALLRGARRERSMYRRGPIFDVLQDPDVLDLDGLAHSGTVLRIAVVALESGELRYVSGTGTLLDRENRPVPGEGPVSVIDAVLASCAIPAVYPPVRLGREHYVDGGMRENAPVEVAMTHLGVDRCYAVVSTPVGLPPDSSYADKDMLSIVLRATAGIMADELQLNDVARARAEGAVVIAPEVNLLGLFDLDPGLLAIARDYGYLRAAEACEGAAAEEQRVTRELVQLRRQLWGLENELLDPGHPDHVGGEVPSDRLAELAALKRQLRDLVAQVPPDRLPPGADQWWRGWEGHPYPISQTVDWGD